MSLSVEREAGRAAVDDAAHGGPVALAEGRDREQSSVGIACHLFLPDSGSMPVAPA